MSRRKKCMMCGKTEIIVRDGMCFVCATRDVQDRAEIENLIKRGHTEHCAKAQVWGPMECECEKQGLVPGLVSALIVNAMEGGV